MGDVNLILRGARGGAHAYRILSEKFEQARECMMNREAFQMEDIELAFPVVMTQTFSCELYLKALLTKNNISYRRTHDLYELFNCLDENTRAKILHYYKEICGTDNDFLVRLQENNIEFSKWRYYFEIDLNKEPGGFHVVDVPFLDDFLVSLEKTILEIL